MGRIGSPAAACSVAGGFCYGRLLDESCIARESQNSPDSCACLRPAPQHLEFSGIREGLPVSREPALLTSAGRMPERSQHRVSEGRMP